jgi:hypothetical protein
METFRLEEHHLKLLANMVIEWNHVGHGAPMVCPKNTYGNGRVYEDVARAMGIEYDDEDMAQYRKLRVIHHEMKTVLQLVIELGHYPAGTIFEREPGGKWTVARKGPGSRIFVGRKLEEVQ